MLKRQLAAGPPLCSCQCCRRHPQPWCNGERSCRGITFGRCGFCTGTGDGESPFFAAHRRCRQSLLGPLLLPLPAAACHHACTHPICTTVPLYCRCAGHQPVCRLPPQVQARLVPARPARHQRKGAWAAVLCTSVWWRYIRVVQGGCCWDGDEPPQNSQGNLMHSVISATLCPPRRGCRAAATTWMGWTASRRRWRRPPPTPPSGAARQHSLAQWKHHAELCSGSVPALVATLACLC